MHPQVKILASHKIQLEENYIAVTFFVIFKPTIQRKIKLIDGHEEAKHPKIAFILLRLLGPLSGLT